MVDRNAFCPMVVRAYQEWRQAPHELKNDPSKLAKAKTLRDQLIDFLSNETVEIIDGHSVVIWDAMCYWCIENNEDITIDLPRISFDRRIVNLTVYDKENNLERMIIPPFLDTFIYSYLGAEEATFSARSLPQSLKNLTVLGKFSDIDYDSLPQQIKLIAFEGTKLESFDFMRLPRTVRTVAIHGQSLIIDWFRDIPESINYIWLSRECVSTSLWEQLVTLLRNINVYRRRFNIPLLKVTRH